MERFNPTLTHGDATTTNFIFPQDGGVVIIDWERMKISDPAGDLGRLMAEVAYTFKQQGGDVADVQDLTQRLLESYCYAMSGNENPDTLQERVRFYRAQANFHRYLSSILMES